MPQSDSYDLVVIGGGPGGCAAAAIAARKGVSTLLLERDAAPRFKIGESLMPGTYSTFEEMGALERIKARGFTEKHSVQFYTRSGKASSPFYFSTWRTGDRARTWQVLRSDFDQVLFEVAADAGAECCRSGRVREILFEGDRAVGVHAEVDGQAAEIRARAIIDATGQSTLLAKKLDLGRVDYGLRKASIYTHFRGGWRDQGIDEGATLILHTEEGRSWFWYIPLADDVISVGVVGDVDYLITERDSRPHETFFEQVDHCAEVRRRLKNGVQCRPVSVARDFSYRYERMAGEGWVLIGDAFSFIDPVYSSGLFLALKSGQLAAEAVAKGLRRNDLSAEQLGGFQPRLMNGVDAIRRLVEVFYTPDFSFGGFLKAYPHHQHNITRILVGDVLDGYFGDLFAAMEAFRSTELPTQPLPRPDLEALRRA